MKWRRRRRSPFLAREFVFQKWRGGEREEEGGVHTRFLNEWSRVYIFRTRKPGYPGA